MIKNIKINNEINVFKPYNLSKVHLMGIAKRVKTNFVSDKYDLIETLTLYFKIHGNLYELKETKTYKDEEIIELKSTMKKIEYKNVKIPTNKNSKNGTVSHTTKYYLPKKYEFMLHILNKSEYKNIPTTNKKMIVYGNDVLSFIKDDGYDSERLYGIYLNETNLVKVDNGVLSAMLYRKV